MSVVKTTFNVRADAFSALTKLAGSRGETVGWMLHKLLDYALFLVEHELDGRRVVLAEPDGTLVSVNRP